MVITHGKKNQPDFVVVVVVIDTTLISSYIFLSLIWVSFKIDSERVFLE